MEIHKKYKKKTMEKFYPWMEKHTNVIDDYDGIIEAYNMFDLSNISIQNIKVRFKSINSVDLKRIMSNEGLIFI